ncbi:putative ribonuclease H-like domain-containing protein [Tanacetum coccineum]
MDFKEKRPVSLDKSKIKCYNCHRKGYFAWECRSRRNQRKRSYGNNGRSNAPTNESSSQALVAQDGLGGYDWSNNFEIEPVNYALMAISFFSSDFLQTISTDHLIKDCNFHDKQSQEPKPKNVVILSQGWSNQYGDNAEEKALTRKGLENQLNHNVKIIRCDNETEFKNHVINEFSDSLGKFDGKSDEGYLLGYSTTSKAFRVYNKRTKMVEENLRIDFLEDQPNVTGTSTQDSYVVGSSEKDKGPTQEYILLPLQPHRTRSLVEDVALAAHEKPSKKVVAKALDDATRQAFEEEKRNIASQKRAAQATSTNKLSTVRSYVSTATTPYVSAASTPTGANAGESSLVYLGGQIPIDASTLLNADLPTDLNMPDLEDVSNAFPNDGIFSRAYNDDDVGAEADFNNMDNTIDVSPIPTLKVHKDHPKGKILGDPKSEKVWVLVDLPYGKKVIGTKWVFRNKSDERSIVVKNKARLVAQGFRQEEGVDYNEVFAPVARIEAIRLFLAFASYMGFTVYQMDVKSEFLYGTI